MKNIYRYQCFVLALVILTSAHSYGTEVVKGQVIGTLIQTESAKRLKEFPLTTLEDHAEILKPAELAKKKSSMILDPRAISWGFRPTYLGESRTISGVRKQFLDMVATQRKKFAKLYSTEVLVSDGNENFWLPIQDTVLTHFKVEIKKGDLFNAETRYFGSYFDTKPRQFFMLIDFIQVPK